MPSGRHDLFVTEISSSSCSGPSSLHVITGLWKHTGGPAETVPALCSSLAAGGSRTSLATLRGDMADTVAPAAATGVNVHIYPPTVRHTVWYSRSLHKHLPALVADHDVIHAHAMWQAPGWLACAEARRQGRPIVISPRGSLLPQRLAKSRCKKQLASLLFDRRNVRGAAAMHATSHEEAISIRAFGYQGPLAVIPNGVEVPSDTDLALSMAAEPDFRSRFPETTGKRVLLFLSRIEPTKGVVSLAHVWGKIAPRHTDWHLVIAGPDERNHVRKVRRILDAHGASRRTSVAGPLYTTERDQAFAACELFVLPTRSENFGMAIGESLARSRPVITTVGAPWPGLQDHECGWWIPHGEDALEHALDEALSLPASTLGRMGARGREWMQRDYAWPAIAARMHSVYRWLVGGPDKPPCDVLMAAEG